jgi:hypothetical protein
VASNEAARSTGSMAPMSRRQVSGVYQFLSPHQAAVLDVATSCLMPGAGELDHPGVQMVTYVDRLLSQCDAQTAARRVRVADLRDHFANGIALLDELAGGDFTAVPRLRQDLILSHTQVTAFVSLLFDHIVKAMYAVPENADRRVVPRHGIAMA